MITVVNIKLWLIYWVTEIHENSTIYAKWTSNYNVVISEFQQKNYVCRCNLNVFSYHRVKELSVASKKQNEKFQKK